MQTRSCDEISVRVIIIIIIIIIKCIFIAQNRVMQLMRSTMRWSEIADFRSIFSRSASAVTAKEKSSIITNRKLHTGFRLVPTSMTSDGWPWMTLNGVTALILRFFADFDFFAGQIRCSGWI